MADQQQQQMIRGPSIGTLVIGTGLGLFATFIIKAMFQKEIDHSLGIQPSQRL